MAASLPGGFFRGPLSSSFLQFSKSLSAQPWRAVGGASAVALGLSLTLSNLPVFAEKKDGLEKWVHDALLLLPDTPGVHFPSFGSLSFGPVQYLVEPKTGVEFPGASADGKQLTGVGLRKKSVFGLKSIVVYAYGLYTDPETLKSNLGGKYDGFTPTELSQTEELFVDVIGSDVGLTVRLVIVYGRLQIKSIRSAFEESVGKGIKKFSGEENRELLGRFTSIFTDDLRIPKGTTIDLSRDPGQVLTARINGLHIGSIKSPLLCRALFDLYIGEDSFDKQAREGMGIGFADLLSHEEWKSSSVV